MPVPAIEYDWTVQPDLRSIAGRGPTLTFTRNDQFGWCPDHSKYNHYVAENIPKFKGFHMSDNWFRHSDDLNDVLWTKTNVTVAKDETGYRGGANAAWTITDDATDAQHVLTQPINYLTSLTLKFMSQDIILKINRTASTARYVFVTNDDTVPSRSDRTFIFDLQDRVFTVDSGIGAQNWDAWGINSAIYEPDPAGDWIFLRIGVTFRGGQLNYRLGIAGGPDLADQQYIGSGDTLVIDELWSSSGSSDHSYNERGLWPGHTGAIRQHVYYTTRHTRNEVINSEMFGAVQNTAVPSDYYGYYWDYPAGQTGDAIPVASKLGWPVNGKPPSTQFLFQGSKRGVDGHDQNAMRFVGTNETAYHWYAPGYDWAHPMFATSLYSIWLEECVEDPGTPVVFVDNFYWGWGDDYFYPDGQKFYIKDFRLQPDGKRRLDFRVIAPAALPGVYFGLGADGTPSTGNFTLSSLMIVGGEAQLPYIRDSGLTWYESECDFSQGISHLGQGLIVEPARTTLIINSVNPSIAPWTAAVGIDTIQDDGTWQAKPFYGGNRLDPLDVGGPGESKVAQPLTLATSTLYTMSGHVWVFDPNILVIPGWTDWGYIGLDNYDSDIGFYFQYADGNLGTVGADVTEINVSREIDRFYRIETVFTSDGVDTTADWVVALAEADGDRVMPYSDDYANTWGGWQVYVGEPLYVTQFLTGSTNYTTEPDVVTTDDLSDLSGSAHSLLIELECPKYFYDDKTIVSLYSSATARIALEVIGSTLHFIGVNTTTQWDITASLTGLEGTRLVIAVAWNTGDIAAYLNGVQMGVDGAASIPSVTDMNIGSDHADLEQVNTLLVRLQIFNERVSNATLSEWSVTSRTGDMRRFGRSSGRAIGNRIGTAIHEGVQ